MLCPTSIESDAVRALMITTTQFYSTSTSKNMCKNPYPILQSWFVTADWTLPPIWWWVSQMADLKHVFDKSFFNHSRHRSPTQHQLQWLSTNKAVSRRLVHLSDRRLNAAVNSWMKRSVTVAAPWGHSFKCFKCFAIWSRQASRLKWPHVVCHVANSSCLSPRTAVFVQIAA